MTHLCKINLRNNNREKKNWNNHWLPCRENLNWPFFKAEDLRKERNAAIREIYTIEEERMKIIDGIIKKSLDAKRIITI